MVTPSAFASTYRRYAVRNAEPFGLDPDLFLTQWAVEVAWGESFAASYNLGNIRGPGGPFQNFANFDDYVNTAIWTLAHAGDPVGSGTYYAGVRASASHAVDAQMIALGKSPWDAGHYMDTRGGPGTKLIRFWEELRMSTLDNIFKVLGRDATANYLGWSRGVTTKLDNLKLEVDQVKSELDQVKTQGVTVDLSELTGKVDSLSAALAALTVTVQKIENALRAA
jgi:hypothetical protein